MARAVCDQLTRAAPRAAPLAQPRRRARRPLAVRSVGRSAREQRQHHLQLDLGLRQLSGRVRVADDPAARVAAARRPAQQRAPQRDAELPVAGRVGPADRARRTSRGRSPRAPGSTPAPPAGSAPTAGVGCSSPASLTASSGAASWARIGAARCWMLATLTTTGSAAAVPRPRAAQRPRDPPRDDQSSPAVLVASAAAARRGDRRPPGRPSGGSSPPAPRLSRAGPVRRNNSSGVAPMKVASPLPTA